MGSSPESGIPVEIHCAALLFDLDGVLVDSIAVVEEHWAAWARRHGLDPVAVVERSHGQPTIRTVREMTPHLDADSETFALEDGVRRDAHRVPAYPGAVELLTALPPERWAIVTSGTKASALARMDAAGLPRPRAMVAADEVTHGKPDPEPYLRGAELLGMPAADCVVVEDAPAGVTAGLAAGMRVVGVTTTRTPAQMADATWLVADVARLRLDDALDGLTLRLDPA